MNDVVVEGPDARRRPEVVLVLGHDLDDPEDQVAGALPRDLGWREEARRREARLGGRGCGGTQNPKRHHHDTAVPGHCSSDLVTIPCPVKSSRLYPPNVAYQRLRALRAVGC